MSSTVVDTNVPIIANNKSVDCSSDCVLKCIDALESIKQKGKLVLDEGGEIFSEYIKHMSFSGQPGVGDSFLKWLHENQFNPQKCERVKISPKITHWTGFHQFPNDPDLKTFDPSDRKFVAVSCTSSARPPILNASDTGWWIHRKALKRNGVTVIFVCPELMKRNDSRDSPTPKKWRSKHGEA